MKRQTVKSMKYNRFERFVDWVLGFFVRWNFWFTILEPSYFRDRFGFHSRGDPYIEVMDKLLSEIVKRPLTNLGRVLVHISVRKAMKNRMKRYAEEDRGYYERVTRYHGSHITRLTVKQKKWMKEAMIGIDPNQGVR